MELFDNFVGLIARNPRAVAICVLVAAAYVALTSTYSWITSKGNRFARLPGMKEYGRTTTQQSRLGSAGYGGTGILASVSDNPALQPRILSAPLQDQMGPEVMYGFTGGRKGLTTVSTAAMNDLAGQRLLGNVSPVKNFAPKSILFNSAGNLRTEVPF